jgi:V8-like Glu-specific endopeptidase
MQRANTRSLTRPRGVASDRRGREPDERAFAVDPSSPENWRHGKLFGKDRTGAYECSATAVASQNRSVIFTAGHCVRYNGNWAKKLVFVPAYDRGQRPFGAWVWDVIRVPRQWASRENDNYDYATVAMSPQNGVRLTDAVGAAGIAWNQPRDVPFSLFGYPTNFYDGQRMTGCVGTGFPGDDAGRGPPTVGVSCDMGQGSSGGGWLIGGGYLNSVMSYGLRNRPDLSFGPYFTGAANSLLERSARD